MNFLKDVVLGLVGLIALNAVGYLAMNTSMGYDIIVYGCIIIVELLVMMWFVKWIRPRAESIDDDEYDDYDYDYDDDYDDDDYDYDCHCGDCLNDDQKIELEEACQQLDDAVAYLDRIMAQSSRADESTTNLDSETTVETAREECENNEPNVEETVEPEHESDTTSLDDLIAEVKNF